MVRASRTPKTTAAAVAAGERAALEFVVKALATMVDATEDDMERLRATRSLLTALRDLNAYDVAQAREVRLSAAAVSASTSSIEATAVLDELAAMRERRA